MGGKENQKRGGPKEKGWVGKEGALGGVDQKKDVRAPEKA